MTVYAVECKVRMQDLLKKEKADGGIIFINLYNVLMGHTVPGLTLVNCFHLFNAYFKHLLSTTFWKQQMNQSRLGLYPIREHT